jgi:hypothetical protein
VENKQKVVFEPDYLAAFAARIPEPVDESYLEARSQFSCWNRTPSGFLHKLYQPGESVWITTNAKSGDGEIWRHRGQAQRFDELKHLVSGHQGVWFLTNPINGHLHAVERCKSRHNPEGLTFTTVECVSAWRFLMFETDVAPRDQWRKAIVQFQLPVVALYESGGNGDHVLVRLEARSKEHWERLCSQYDNNLIRLGACPGSLTARRLSRLPNCMREQTGRRSGFYICAPMLTGRQFVKIPPRPLLRGN